MAKDLDLDKNKPRATGRRRPNSYIPLSGPLSLAMAAVREARKLNPEALVLRAEMDAISGNIFAFLDYFAQQIERHNLKPWGRKGKESLIAAISVLKKNGAYDSWAQCCRCGGEFMPMEDVALIHRFLSHYRGNSDWDELCKCQDCRERDKS